VATPAANSKARTTPADLALRLIFAFLLLLLYALVRRDPVFIAGQAFGVFVYARNLYWVLRDRKLAPPTG
jgi:lipid-A-disaccharide synthase-like uncharacterized protein